jgi:hypothetical protein
MSAPITLQQFTQRYGKFKFLKLALLLRAPKPAFRHVLITLADYADGKTGVAYPGYERLMFETGYASKQTITSALQHWKKAGVLSWRKGWGNAHDSKSNVYQFHDDVIWRMLGTQSGMILESPLNDSRKSTEAGLESPLSPMKAQSVVANDSVGKRLSKSKGGATLEIDLPEPQKTGTAHVEESPIGGISYESPVSGLSSPAYDVREPLTIAEILSQLPKAKAMSLYNRTDGHYTLAQAQAALDAHLASLVAP